jgi:peptide/nickel transport system permease protein
VTLVYLAKRLGLLFLVMWTAATINFFIPKLSPRDPILEKLQQAAMTGGRQQSGLKEMVELYQKQFGLDRPLWEQYLTHMGNMARLDFGYSLAQYPRRVMDVIGEALPWTIGLALTTTLLSFAIGTIFGALIAWPKAPRFLRYFMPPLIVLYAIPGFLLAFILIYFLAFRWRMLPLAGAYSRGAIPSFSPRFILDLMRHATLPALALILTALGGWALAMRGMMVTVQGEDYITYAEARGLHPRRIFLKYAVRNALLPQITGLILSLGLLITANILVEGIFGYPGLGLVVLNAIQNLDYFVIYGVTMILVLAISFATLFLDLIYPLLDPRIKYEGG